MPEQMNYSPDQGEGQGPDNQTAPDATRQSPERAGNPELAGIPTAVAEFLEKDFRSNRGRIESQLKNMYQRRGIANWGAYENYANAAIDFVNTESKETNKNEQAIRAKQEIIGEYNNYRYQWTLFNRATAILETPVKTGSRGREEYSYFGTEKKYGKDHDKTPLEVVSLAIDSRIQHRWGEINNTPPPHGRTSWTPAETARHRQDIARYQEIQQKIREAAAPEPRYSKKEYGKIIESQQKHAFEKEKQAARLAKTIGRWGGRR